MMFTMLAGVLVVVARCVRTMLVLMDMFVLVFVVMSLCRSMNMLMCVYVGMRMGSFHNSAPFMLIKYYHSFLHN
ncbi:MAG: hypothetical protein QM706_16065 [Nitrospira sp.]